MPDPQLKGTQIEVGDSLALESAFDVFLSYNREDKEAVQALAHLLSEEGLQPWLDEWNSIPGTDWQTEMQTVLTRCRSVAVLVGPGGISKWQKAEMDAAISRRIRENGIFKVIPVLLPGVNPAVMDHLPFLSASTWVQFPNTIDDQKALHRLVSGIRGRAPGAPRRGKGTLQVTFEGTIEELNSATIKAIFGELGKYSGDATLTLRTIKRGSIKLVIEGDELALERLDFLFRTGQLKEILGAKVQDVIIIQQPNATTGFAPETKGAPVPVVASRITSSLERAAVFGIYRSNDRAEDAIDVLRAAGFLNNDISFLAPDQKSTHELATGKNTEAPEGATTGTTAGRVIGGALGWLAGTGALAIPGAGPFIAAGPIMGALAGLGVGGALGGLAGALVGIGIPEYEAKRYERRIRDGGVLLSVHCDNSDWARSANEIFHHTGAEDISSPFEVRSDAAVEQMHDSIGYYKKH